MKYSCYYSLYVEYSVNHFIILTVFWIPIIYTQSNPALWKILTIALKLEKHFMIYSKHNIYKYKTRLCTQNFIIYNTVFSRHAAPPRCILNRLWYSWREIRTDGVGVEGNKDLWAHKLYIIHILTLKQFCAPSLPLPLPPKPTQLHPTGP